MADQLATDADTRRISITGLEGSRLAAIVAVAEEIAHEVSFMAVARYAFPRTSCGTCLRAVGKHLDDTVTNATKCVFRQAALVRTRCSPARESQRHRRTRPPRQPPGYKT